MKLSELKQKEVKIVQPKLSDFDSSEIKVIEPVKEPNYFQRVGRGYAEAGQDIISGIKKGAQEIQAGNPFGQLRAGLRTVGGVARAAFEPIIQAPIIKPIVENIGKNIVQIPGVEDLIVKTSEIAKNYPEASKDIQNIIDIVTLGGGKAIEAPLASEARLIGRDIIEGTKYAITPSEKAVQEGVVELFNQSIKPTTKKTLGTSEKYENSVLTALRTVKENAPNLNIESFDGELVNRAPETISELAQAVDQTKEIVFRQYDEIANRAGQQGVTINLGKIADELDGVINNKALNFARPEVVQYAKETQARLRQFSIDDKGKFAGYQKLDPQTAQEIIKFYNQSLQAFYRNPTYESASKAAIDAGVVNNFRKSLDEAIENATGEQYQALKNQYSALKSIEADVIRAATRDARRNARGLLDYTDIFTSGQMIGGILSLNPAMFTKGAVERGFKEYIKYLNDPNRAIKSIFDNIGTGRQANFIPESATGQFIANPKIGLSIEDVTKRADYIPEELKPLAKEAMKYKSAEEFVKLPKEKRAQVEYLTNLFKNNKDTKIYATENGRKFILRDVESITADYVEVPTTMRSSNDFRTVKNFIVKFKDGTTDTYKNPIFNISDETKSQLTDIWERAKDLKQRSKKQKGK